MKKIKRIVSIFLIALVLNGCVKYDIQMNINKDKSVNIQAYYFVNSKFVDIDHLDTNEELFKKRNIKIQTMKQNNYTGVKLTKKFDDIDDISSEKDITIFINDIIDPKFDDEVLFKVEKGFLKNKYTANYKYDTTINTEVAEKYLDIFKSDDSISINNNEEIKNNANKISNENVFSYKVVLPVKTISDNAFKKENSGKTLIWDIKPNDVATINFSFELKNTSNYIIFYISLSLVILITICLVVFLTIKIKGKIKFRNSSKYPIHTDYDPSIEDIVFSETNPKSSNVNIIINDDQIEEEKDFAQEDE